jgi:hypothetical protein
MPYLSILPESSFLGWFLSDREGFEESNFQVRRLHMHGHRFEEHAQCCSAISLFPPGGDFRNHLREDNLCRKKLNTYDVRKKFYGRCGVLRKGEVCLYVISSLNTGGVLVTISFSWRNKVHAEDCNGPDWVAIFYWMFCCMWIRLHCLKIMILQCVPKFINSQSRF